MANPLGTLPQASLGGMGSSGYRRRRQEQPGGATSGSGGASHFPAVNGQPTTFAQMQANGQARPAPPSAAPAPPATPASVGSQLTNSVSQALASPSRYDTPTFNTLRDSATADLENKYGRIRRTTNEDLARRGLAASTIAGDSLHDVDAAQSRDLADLNSTLLRDAATTQGADRASAINAGQTFTSQNTSQGQTQQQIDLAKLLGTGNLTVAQQQANTAEKGTLGGLDIQKSNLALETGKALGSINGQSTLEKQQQDTATALATAGLTGLMADGTQTLAAKQAAIQNAIQQGHLTIEQGQLALAQLTQKDQSANAAGQLALATKVQLGQLTIAQAQQALDEKVKTGELTIDQARQQLAEMTQKAQESQFASGQAQQAGQFSQNQLMQYVLAALQYGVKIPDDILAKLGLGSGAANQNSNTTQNQPATPTETEDMANVFSSVTGRQPTKEEILALTEMWRKSGYDQFSSWVKQYYGGS